VSENTRHDPRAEPVDRTVDDRRDSVDPAVDDRRDPVDPTVDDRSPGDGDLVDHTDTGAPVAATSHPVDTERDSRQGDVQRDPSSERVRSDPSTGPGASTQWNAYPGLLPDEDLGGYQRRWDEIQVRFIDEPRQSVREADGLVDEVTSQIAERFTRSRQDFDERWETDNEPTTEELRQALQRYRDFFKRLVST
jgi:hypothetical protein